MRKAGRCWPSRAPYNGNLALVLIRPKSDDIDKRAYLVGLTMAAATRAVELAPETPQHDVRSRMPSLFPASLSSYEWRLNEP